MGRRYLNVDASPPRGSPLAPLPAVVDVRPSYRSGRKISVTHRTGSGSSRGFVTYSQNGPAARTPARSCSRSHAARRGELADLGVGRLGSGLGVGRARA